MHQDSGPRCSRFAAPATVSAQAIALLLLGWGMIAPALSLADEPSSPPRSPTHTIEGRPPQDIDAPRVAILHRLPETGLLEQADPDAARERMTAERNALLGRLEEIHIQRKTTAAEMEQVSTRVGQVRIRRERMIANHEERRQQMVQDGRAASAIRELDAAAAARLREVDSELARLHGAEQQLAQRAIDLESEQARIEKQLGQLEAQQQQIYPSYRAPAPAGRPVDILASRRFLPPHQYPPEDYAAYGILAFPHGVTSATRTRYQMICEAYVATLPPSDRLPAPLEQQMVTVWPIDDEAVAARLEQAAREPGPFALCGDAVGHYDFVTARWAIRHAEAAGVRLGHGEGPFLLAWSPSSDKGNPDAIVLVADLSGVPTQSAINTRFQEWVADIESNPELWAGGWSVDRLRRVVRDWADRYGPLVLRLFAPGEES